MDVGRIAYCVTPRTGGTFRFYGNLRRALAGHGWEVFAPAIGAHGAADWDHAFADAGCERVAPTEHDPARAARAFADWLEQGRIDVMIPMCNPIAASVVPHLPPRVRVVTRCSTVTRFGYRICMADSARVSRVVATSPAQLRGLQARFPGCAGRIQLIAHGVDTDQFRHDSVRSADENRPLRIVYLGRLEDMDKGVLWLPDIAAALARRDVAFELDVIGDGPDRERLVTQLRRKAPTARVRMLGQRTRTEVAGMLGGYDVLVMPSRFEGFPNTLVEAMAAGVVPVVSRITGVTDFIVEDNVSGLLSPIGRPTRFAAAIAGLASERKRLTTMAAAARARVDALFSLERMGGNYDRLFRDVLTETVSPGRPRPWAAFHVDPAYRPTWRRWIPQRLKNAVRQYALG